MGLLLNSAFGLLYSPSESQYSYSDGKFDRNLGWGLGIVRKNCSSREPVFWSFLTKTKWDQALPSHVYGKLFFIDELIGKDSGPHVAGAWTERQKMFLGGSFLKFADDNKYIKNPEAQNREVRGF